MEDAEQLLKEAGFAIVKRRTLERDMVYDTPDGALRRASKLLRIRISGSDVQLTYKGPPQRGAYKDREEIETGVMDGSALGLVLERLDLHPSFRYEKYRTHYSRPGEDGEAMLDETPIGVFIELEGSPDWIDASAQRMGYTQSDYVTASYARLYFESKGGEPKMPAQMVFGGPQE